MSLVVATHNGPFHADDVVAVALLRHFVDSHLTITRSRVQEKWDEADVVVDVGGLYEPERCRFDHHQKSYTGSLSSAGMVLHWLTTSGRIDGALSQYLNDELVLYVDDVDNGRVAPKAGVPCLPRVVEALNQPAAADQSYDVAFVGAVDVAEAFILGLKTTWEREQVARVMVQQAMETAERAQSRVLYFEEYYRWKRAYFELGGSDHPTEFVVFPGTDGSWRIIAIPPKFGDFGQKRPLPASWAGLTDEALAAVTGIDGSVFCHKNRFIAVFQSRADVERALEWIAEHDA